MKKILVLTIAVLMAGIFFQVVFLFGKYVPDLISVRSNLGKSSVWRGTNFNQSEKVANFIEFLDQNIPENARVVLPALGSSRKILDTPYMQFFLAPREVINCHNVECLQKISREKTYFVIIGNLPPEILKDGSILMFDENWGVLLPESFSKSDTLSQVKGFDSLRDLLLSVVWPILWITVLTLTGTIIVISLLPGREKLLRIALGYGMGLGLFSLAVAIVGILGFSLNKVMIIGITVVLMGVAMCIFAMEKRSREVIRFSTKSEEKKAKINFFPLIIIGIGILSAVLAVGKGYHRLDSIQIWGVKGYGIAASGLLENVTDWGTNTLAYPLHIPVLVASFRVLFGDVLPSSKMIFSGYFLALMLVMYFGLVRIGVKYWVSGLTVILLMTAPLIFRHSTIGYANLPLTFYLVASTIIFIIAYNRFFAKRILFLSGFFLVCAAWTRPEGLILACGGAGLLILLTLNDQETSLSWKKIAIYIGPLIIYILFWQFVKTKVYPEPFSNSNLISEAFHQIFSGNLHLGEAYYILAYFWKELVNLKVFGGMGLLLFTALILIVVSRKSLPRPARLLLAVGGLYLLMIIGMYYLISYGDTHDLSWWVISGLMRMSFPGLIILWLGVISTLNNIILDVE